MIVEAAKTADAMSDLEEEWHALVDLEEEEWPHALDELKQEEWPHTLAELKQE